MQRAIKPTPTITSPVEPEPPEMHIFRLDEMETAERYALAESVGTEYCRAVMRFVDAESDESAIAFANAERMLLRFKGTQAHHFRRDSLAWVVVRCAEATRVLYATGQGREELTRAHGELMRRFGSAERSDER